MEGRVEEEELREIGGSGNSSRNSQYVQSGENNWTLVHHEDLRDLRHNIIGFGNASIPSYECLARSMPDRKLNIICLTWNINEKPANILKSVAEFLSKKQTAGVLEDVVCIAIQEIPPQSRSFHEEALSVVAPLIERTHTIYFSHRAWSQMLMIFIANHHLKYAISDPTVKFIPCKAMAKPIRTKGSVGVCFRLYQRMIVVVASHFSHSSIENRKANYHKMVSLLRFPTLRSYTGGKDEMFSGDVVLWMGDLNFRMARGSLVLQNVLPHPNDVLIYDELTNQMTKGTIFIGFREAGISFPPTHKIQPNGNDYVEGRTPSYTLCFHDRVLYWSKAEELVAPVEYGCIAEQTASDHRAVFCAFRVLAINAPIPDKFFSQRSASTSRVIEARKQTDTLSCSNSG